MNGEQHLGDTQGLNLGFCRSLSEVLSVLAQQASKPASDLTDTPVVCLESDNN